MKKKIDKKQKIKKFNNRPAVFLDRDGTINHDYGYVYKFSDFKFRPYVIKGLKYLSKKKYLIFIVTNQAGIAKGKFKTSDLKKLHSKIKKYLIKKNIYITGIEYCPYHPNAKIKIYKKKTNFRKPGNLMIQKIKNKWNLNLTNSFMLGDKKTDQQAAKKSRLYFEYVKNNFYLQIKKIEKKIISSY